jgi:ribosomal protein S18 acetylase RimI-like enzyme
MADDAPPLPPQCLVERVTEITDDDLHLLCEATSAAIIDGGGFGWVNPPGMLALETYFRGVLLVPERELFLARLDGLVVGSAHLVRPPRNNEAQGHAAQLMHAYIAPYARGHGLARMLTIDVEDRARELGYHVLNLDVRETQEAAIRLYESLGFERWGVHPDYAFVRGQAPRAPPPARGGGGGGGGGPPPRVAPRAPSPQPPPARGGGEPWPCSTANPLPRDRPEGRPVRPSASRGDG